MNNLKKLCFLLSAAIAFGVYAPKINTMQKKTQVQKLKEQYEKKIALQKGTQVTPIKEKKPSVEKTTIVKKVVVSKTSIPTKTLSKEDYSKNFSGEFELESYIENNIKTLRKNRFGPRITIIKDKQAANKNYDETGTISGDGGCNGFSAEYKRKNNFINIDSLGHTEACIVSVERDPETRELYVTDREIMNLEETFFRLFNTAESFDVSSDNKLTINCKNAAKLIFSSPKPAKKITGERVRQ